MQDRATLSIFAAGFLLLSMLAGLLSPAAHAEKLNRASHCGQIKNDTLRLACYDSLMLCSRFLDNEERLSCLDAAYQTWLQEQAQMPEVVEQPGAEQPPGAEQQPPDAGQEIVKGATTETFGKPEKKKPRKKLKITATITKVQQDGRRVDYLTLDNGQVWRETTDMHVKFKEGQQVTIETGILGSYSLHVEGVRRLIKVKRVK